MFVVELGFSRSRTNFTILASVILDNMVWGLKIAFELEGNVSNSSTDNFATLPAKTKRLAMTYRLGEIINSWKPVFVLEHNGWGLLLIRSLP